MNYMNLKNLTLLFVMEFLGMSLTGCNAKKENTTQEEMARGSYSVEKNQVTVVPLERKTFNKQLICNGKLEAYSKVNLQTKFFQFVATSFPKDVTNPIPVTTTRLWFIAKTQ